MQSAVVFAVLCFVMAGPPAVFFWSAQRNRMEEKQIRGKDHRDWSLCMYALGMMSCFIGFFLQKLM